MIVITTGKKVLVACLAGAQSKNNDPCQDMKPGPQGKLMYYYFYHGSDLREIIRFLCEIECIEFECNEFVLVLVQIVHDRYYDQKKNSSSPLSGGCAIVIMTRKKKVLVVCLAGARSLLRPEKKVLVVCLAGAQSQL